MIPAFKKGLIGCGLAGALGACVIGIWWVQRGGRVVRRTELVGPETQAFATFIADKGDPAVEDLLGSALRRLRTSRSENQPDGVRIVSEFLSGAGVSKDPEMLFPLRATATIENLPGGEGRLGFILSLGRMANLARLLLGLADSERETETYRGEKIKLGRGGHDLSLSLIKNNLILSSDLATIRTLIDRLKGPAGAGHPSETMAACIQGVDPGGEMPGFGAIVNDRKSVATVWQLGTGAPEGSEVSLPDEFEGVGFRFAVKSSDTIRGDGFFYFEDEEAAAGSQEALKSGLSRLFSHFGLRPKVALHQDGSRLAVSVEASGVQAALDRLFVRPQSAAVPR